MSTPFAEAFATFAANGGGKPDWLAPVRQRAFARFAEVGIPTTRDEEWRFTPVAPLLEHPFAPVSAAARPLAAAELAPFIFGHTEWPMLVFVDGRYREELSVLPELADGVTLGSVAEAVTRDHPLVREHLGRYAGPEATPFTALNLAFVRDGVLLHVPAGVTLAQPVHALFVSTGDTTDAAAHPRNLIVVDAGARASFIESYVTLAPGARYLTNTVTEMVLGPQAWMEHSRIQRESESAFHLGFTQVDQARDSHYRSFTLSMGGAIARHNLHVQMNDSNVESLLYGLYLGRGTQLVDNHTAIFHDHPHCNSWEVYKGILDDRSRAVFNGKVFVKPEAQKTDAKQTNRTLLLSDGAKIDTKPQLEIFADDVKCTHGATVGQLDELPLFYARSRGIPADAARTLLTWAFAAEVIDEVAVAPVREELGRLVHARLTEGA